MEVAAKVGLDFNSLKRDMDDPTIHSMIDRNLALAQALRINGTPSFVAGNQIVRGAVDLKILQALIREAREKNCPTSAWEPRSATIPKISNIGVLTAFAAGIFSFLSPCVLPLVPGYVS